MIRYFQSSIFVVCVAFISTPAAASPITWLLEGTVFTSSIPGVAVGDAASMLLTFESSTPDLEPSPSCGLYVGAIVSATAVFGSQAFTAGPQPVGGIEISDGSGSVIACGITPGQVPAYTYRAFGGANLIAFFEYGPVPSDALLLEPPDFWLFQSGIRVIAHSGDAIALLHSARVVPEPATIVLLATGFAGAFCARRRRNR
jgi:hypothetical protein